MSVVRLAAGCVIAFVATAASAADLPVKALHKESVYNWTGLYAGGHIGYVWGDVRNNTINPTVSNIHPEGVFGGFQLGYNYQLPNRWVFGLELAVPIASAADTVPEPTAPGLTFSGELLYGVTVLGKVGYAFGRTLPYGFAGFVYGRGEGRVQGLGFDQTVERSHVGWAAGFGIDHAIAPQWSIFGRYTHVDLSNEDYNFTFGTRNVGFSADSLVFGVNYHLSR
jgi:opacity protein-like surface antigen